MDKELKNYLDKLEKNINSHTDKVGQSIRDDFSTRMNKLELDIKNYKDVISLKFNAVTTDTNDINYTNTGLTFRRFTNQ